jgi:DNA-binding transcriptional regulator GbsR (MarR family)
VSVLAYKKFWLWLSNLFYEKLRDDLVHYGEKLAEALIKNDEPNIKNYLRMIAETRDALNDISDENMPIKDFAQFMTRESQVISDEQ